MALRCSTVSPSLRCASIATCSWNVFLMRSCSVAFELGARFRLRAAVAARIVSPSCPVSGLSPGLLVASPEGGGAPEWRKSFTGHLMKAPACRVTGRRAFRRSTAAIFLHSHRTSWPGPEVFTFTLSGRHLRRRSSRPVQPSKADPSSGSGSDCASWDEVARPRLQAPPSPLRHRTPPEGALSERGRCAPYANQGRCQIRTPSLQGLSTVVLPLEIYCVRPDVRCRWQSGHGPINEECPLMTLAV
jgi:hypothetical protein